MSSTRCRAASRSLFVLSPPEARLQRSRLVVHTAPEARCCDTASVFAAVLVPERTPRDSSWGDLCHELGLVLLARNEIERAPQLLPTHSRRNNDITLCK